MPRYKNIYILTIVVILSVLAQPALALEANYPSIPGVAITSSSSITQYIQYLFTFIIVIAGIIGVVSIIISGLQILVSAGSPTAIGAARERILGSVLGIALLMFSVIILRTINPDLVRPRAGALPITQGVYYMGDVPVDEDHPDGHIYGQAALSVSDTSDPSEFEFFTYSKLFYNCTDPTGPILLVSLYSRPEFRIDRAKNGAPNVTTRMIKCGDPMDTRTIDLSDPTYPVYSFQISYDDPGVYFYLTNDCTGISSPVQVIDKDIDDFDDEYFDQIQSVRIASGQDERKRYGVVLNKSSNFSGECSSPILNPNPGSICASEDDVPGVDMVLQKDPSGNYFNPYSMDIIRQRVSDPVNPDFLTNQTVTLFSQNMYVNLSKSSRNPLLVLSSHFSTGNPDRLFLIPEEEEGAKPYTDSGAEFGECEYPDEPCLENIEAKGNFYIILYSQNRLLEDSKTCTVFTGQNININTSDILEYNRTIYKMDIIPRF